MRVYLNFNMDNDHEKLKVDSAVDDTEEVDDDVDVPECKAVESKVITNEVNEYMRNIVHIDHGYTTLNVEKTSDGPNTPNQTPSVDQVNGSASETTHDLISGKECALFPVYRIPPSAIGRTTKTPSKTPASEFSGFNSRGRPKNTESDIATSLNAESIQEVFQSMITMTSLAPMQDLDHVIGCEGTKNEAQKDNGNTRDDIDPKDTDTPKDNESKLKEVNEIKTEAYEKEDNNDKPDEQKPHLCGKKEEKAKPKKKTNNNKNKRKDKKPNKSGQVYIIDTLIMFYVNNTLDLGNHFDRCRKQTKRYNIAFTNE